MNGMDSVPRYQRGNTVSGLLMGLLIGVIIAAAIALYINFGPKPFVTTDTKNSGGASVKPVEPVLGEPIDLPGKPGDRPVKSTLPSTGQSPATQEGKDQFDFYKILPGGEAASAPRQKASEPQIDNLSLQAGAYQNPSDADNLKARLALLGVEAKVQRVDLGEKGIYYRVRLGPFGNLEEAEGMRARLATEGIETSIVRPNPATGGVKR